MASTNDYDEHLENYNVESSAVYRKLQSKVEALSIMRRELERFRTERDQFKLMAETLQMRYTAIKKSIGGDDGGAISGGSGVITLLNETREKNIALNTEVEALRQKLAELQGDIRVLRDLNATLEVECKNRCEPYVGANEEQCVWMREKSGYIAQMEKLKKANAQMHYDFRSLLDEKEELITERDAYKCKAHRLNHELQVILNTSKSHMQIIDIDALILENKMIQDRVKGLENELELSQQNAAKYKTMLESKRKKGFIKFGSTQSEMILTHKQAQTLLEKSTATELPNKSETISDLKSLCLALLDNVNDKQLALAHQKRTNKILASHITELEQRIHHLMCIDSATATGSESNTNSVATKYLSPSQMLLDGYCPSMVDAEPPSLSNVEEISSSPTPDTIGLNNKTPNQVESSSFSTEGGSEKSCLSGCSDLDSDVMQMLSKNSDAQSTLSTNDDSNDNVKMQTSSLGNISTDDYDGLSRKLVDLIEHLKLHPTCNVDKSKRDDTLLRSNSN